MAENVVNDILKWLETQLQRNEGIKIDTIANKSGYSKWHLQRIFKDFKGCTLGEYVRKRRLLEAAKSLQEKDMSILDIALMYGFSSPKQHLLVSLKNTSTLHQLNLENMVSYQIHVVLCHVKIANIARSID